MMTIIQHKLLHYVLITLLMFAPVRGVMAMQQTHCDMNNNVVVGSAVISENSSHDMTGMSMTSDSGIQKSEKSHDCCSTSNSCVNNCGMHLSVSLLTQNSTYKPNVVNAPSSVVLITDLIKKAFTPPFRPPLVSHS